MSKKKLIGGAVRGSGNGCRGVLFVTQSITNRHTTTTPPYYVRGLVVCVIYNTLSRITPGWL